MNTAYVGEVKEPIVSSTGVVYYIRGTEHLSALNITSNEVLWENSDFFFSNPALNEEESVLYSFLNGSRIGAFSAHNGSLIAVSENVPQKWSFISIPKLVLAPNGNILLNYHSLDKEGILASLDSNLEVMWNISFGGAINNPVISPSGEIACSNYPATEQILFIDPTDGHVKSTVDVPGQFYGATYRNDDVLLVNVNCSTVLISNGTVVDKIDAVVLAVTEDNVMITSVEHPCGFVPPSRSSVQVRHPNGTQIWEVTLKDVLSITALSADSNSVVYVSTENTAGQAIVHALNFTDGTELWKMSLNDDKATLGVGAAVPTPDSSILVLVGPNIHRITSCSGHGTCHSSDVCVCEENYFTANCSVFCDVAECIANSSGHGRCSNEGVCLCDPDYYPTNNCSVFCNSTACSEEHSHHATCSSEGICMCEEHYYGDTCSVYCLHGNGSSNSTECVCDEHYYGHTCEDYCDDEKTCNSHGKCNKEGKCECESGYSGAACVAEGGGLTTTEIIVIAAVAGAVILLIAGVVIYRCVRRKRIGYEQLKE